MRHLEIKMTRCLITIVIVIVVYMKNGPACAMLAYPLARVKQLFGFR